MSEVTLPPRRGSLPGRQVKRALPTPWARASPVSPASPTSSTSWSQPPLPHLPKHGKHLKRSRAPASFSLSTFHPLASSWCKRTVCPRGYVSPGPPGGHVGPPWVHGSEDLQPRLTKINLKQKREKMEVSSGGYSPDFSVLSFTVWSEVQNANWG